MPSAAQETIEIRELSTQMLQSSSQSRAFRLLIVEDEVGIRVAIEDSLRVAGYEIETANDGEAALQLASEGGFDAIILDLILPLMDGIDVCQKLRERGIDTPVLMLTARAELKDTLRGFSVGADDYLTKPFEVLELLARIRAVLHRTVLRTGEGDSHVHSFGDVRVDTTHGTVWRANKRLHLSTKEYELLRYFVTHPGEALTRNHLLEEVWKSSSEGPSRTVDVHVGWLRKKFEDNPENPRWIRTVYGKGYEFVPD